MCVFGVSGRFVGLEVVNWCEIRVLVVGFVACSGEMSASGFRVIVFSFGGSDCYVNIKWNVSMYLITS